MDFRRIRASSIITFWITASAFLATGQSKSLIDPPTWKNDIQQLRKSLSKFPKNANLQQKLIQIEMRINDVEKKIGKTGDDGAVQKEVLKYNDCFNQTEDLMSGFNNTKIADLEKKIFANKSLREAYERESQDLEKIIDKGAYPVQFTYTNKKGLRVRKTLQDESETREELEASGERISEMEAERMHFQESFEAAVENQAQLSKLLECMQRTMDNIVKNMKS